LSHSAELVELSTNHAVCETAVRIGEVFERVKQLCYDAPVILMLPGAGQAPSETQHLPPLRLPFAISHLRPPFFIASSKTAADASHKRAPMVIGVTN
jgi:hypothetical protein